MALFHITMFSQILGRPAPLNVVIPADSGAGGRKDYPVLYLLHGLTDSCDTWVKNRIEDYAQTYETAIVMPEAQRSFYCDMAQGDDYYHHISSEVTQFCEQVFPLRSSRENVSIAGNSMGGYGAYKIALRNPDKFSKAAALSGVMDIRHMMKLFPEYSRDWKNCFGNDQIPPQEDLYFLMEQYRKTERKLQLFQYCGTKDFLYEDNAAFHQYCTAHHISLKYFEDDGAHDWNSWTAQLSRLFQWMYLKQI